MALKDQTRELMENLPGLTATSDLIADLRLSLGEDEVEKMIVDGLRQVVVSYSNRKRLFKGEMMPIHLSLEQVVGTEKFRIPIVKARLGHFNQWYAQRQKAEELREGEIIEEFAAVERLLARVKDSATTNTLLVNAIED